jgi:hypothetical protein
VSALLLSETAVAAVAVAGVPSFDVALPINAALCVWLSVRGVCVCVCVCACCLTNAAARRVHTSHTCRAENQSQHTQHAVVRLAMESVVVFVVPPRRCSQNLRGRHATASCACA